MEFSLVLMDPIPFSPRVLEEQLTNTSSKAPEIQEQREELEQAVNYAAYSIPFGLGPYLVGLHEEDHEM